jgi:hypothetical protein
MTGTVVVHDPGGPAGTTTAPTPTATTPVETVPAGGSATTPTATAPPSATDMPSPSADQTPLADATALSVRVKLAQRGSSVRGTIRGARGSARARIALTARRGAIGLAVRPAALVGIGSIGALTTQTGTLAFVVKLDSKARAALAKRGRLAVTLLVTAPPVTGTTTPRTFTIVLRPLAR